MFGRRMGPVNRERLERLDACLAGKRAPTIEDVVDAFVRPILQLRSDAEGREQALVVMQFQARAVSHPGEEEFSYLKVHFEPLRSRFMSALSSILPQLAIEDVIWRYNFMCGAILYSMAGPSRMLHPPENMAGIRLRDAGQEGVAIDQLVRFLAAGFRAPSRYATAGAAPKKASPPVPRTRKTSR